MTPGKNEACHLPYATILLYALFIIPNRAKKSNIIFVNLPSFYRETGGRKAAILLGGDDEIMPPAHTTRARLQTGSVPKRESSNPLC